MRATTIFHSVLGEGMEKYLAHKRAIGRRFRTEENVLHILDQYFVQEQISGVQQITPELLDAFLLSRPRESSRSYNHLLSTIRGLFHWLVLQGFLCCVPIEAKPKRRTAERLPFIFDAIAARRLLDVAGALPDNPRVPLRAMTYRTIFAVLYGLGLRVGEAIRLLVSDVDFERQLLVIRESKFYKSRLVPFGPRMSALLRDFLQDACDAVETFPAILLCSHSVRIAPLVPPQSPKPFTVWYPNFTWPRKMELLRHGCIAFVIRLLLARYYGGIAPELIPKLASYSSQPFWDTWIPRRRRFI